MNIKSNHWFIIPLSMVFVGLEFMRNLSNNRSIVLFIITFTGLIYSMFTIKQGSYASENSLSKAIFSLRTNNEPMSTVLEKISKASGYKIVIKTSLEDVSISIQLSNVTLHEAIRRIFQNYNHVEVWDDAEKKLDLYIWDYKGAPVSMSGKNSKFIPSTKTFQE